MPPVRRHKVARQGAATNAASSNNDSQPSIRDLRQRCVEKGLPDHGRRNTLIARLQQHASTNNDATETATMADVPSTSVETTTATPRESPLLNDAQLAQIQSIVARSVQESVNEIATNAARAAVQAMTSTPGPMVPEDPPRFAEPVADNHPETIPFTSETLHISPPTLRADSNIPYGQSFHDVPAAYAKQIQSGEFFELSKLLPKNVFHTTDEEPVVLTLENSVIKVKRATQPATNVTEIEQWTTVFTTYMSVFTHEFPNRAQEFLQYMSIIRHAAQCHRGLGWCIYDFKFRRKAALNKCINWSEIDQQLWLMIFTIPSAVLREEYPLFSNGPQKHASFGAERGGVCHDFNRTGICKRNPCRFRHICNRCDGAHAGNQCPIAQRPRTDEVQSSNSQRNFDRAKR